MMLYWKILVSKPTAWNTVTTKEHHKFVLILQLAVSIHRITIGGFGCVYIRLSICNKYGRGHNEFAGRVTLLQDALHSGCGPNV